MRRCSEGPAEADIAPSAGGCRDPALVEATDGPNEAEVNHRRAPGQGGTAVDRASREPVSRFGKPRRRSRMRARSCSNILTSPQFTASGPHAKWLAPSAARRSRSAPIPGLAGTNPASAASLLLGMMGSDPAS